MSKLNGVPDIIRFATVIDKKGYKRPAISVEYLITDLKMTSIQLLDNGLITEDQFAQHHRVNGLQARYLADLMRNSPN